MSRASSAGNRDFTDDEADAILASPQGRQVIQMMHYSAVGDPDEVAGYLDGFVEHADADELIIVLASPTLETRLRSLDIVADLRDRITPREARRSVPL